MTAPSENNNSKTENPEDTGLPLLRRWRALYAIVLAWFVLLVIGLTFFTHYYTR